MVFRHEGKRLEAIVIPGRTDNESFRVEVLGHRLFHLVLMFSSLLSIVFLKGFFPPVMVRGTRLGARHAHLQGRHRRWGTLEL
jgi:hypothetical protein